MTMNNTNETALAAVQSFIMPNAITNSDFLTDDIGSDFDGLSLSLLRIKIPSGGSLFFEVPTDNPEEPKPEKTITGIIVHNHSANTYWLAGSEFDETIPPLCCSFDGVTGYGDPGGACSVCECNQFGSDEGGGKGKSCKNMRKLYILRSGEAMPIELSLPPTSIKPFNTFASATFVTRGRPTWGTIVEIGLKKMENGVNKYSVATFRKVGDLTSEQIPVMREYAKTFQTQIKKMLNQRVLEAKNNSDLENMTDLDGGYTTEENGEHFAISNGEASGNDTVPAAIPSSNAGANTEKDFINSGAGDLPFN